MAPLPTAALGWVSTGWQPGGHTVGAGGGAGGTGKHGEQLGSLTVATGRRTQPSPACNKAMDTASFLSWLHLLLLSGLSQWRGRGVSYPEPIKRRLGNFLGSSVYAGLNVK